MRQWNGGRRQIESLVAYQKNIFLYFIPNRRVIFIPAFITIAIIIYNKQLSINTVAEMVRMS